MANGAMGFLEPMTKKHFYDVLSGIPNFVDPSVEAWTEEEIDEIRKGNWIERNWKSQTGQMQYKSKRTEFCQAMAASDGTILDVASGPGGGSTPGIVYFNSHAKVLMNDLGVKVLKEWQAYLRKNSMGPNVCFAAFDATNVPIRSQAFDIVTSFGGFSNILGTGKAIYETFRVLKKGGTLFMSDGKVYKDDFHQFPKEVQQKWKVLFPALVNGYRNILEDAGFSVTSYEEVSLGAISPDESDLGKTAQKHGVTLRLVSCYIQAEKP